jgi:hypothetical protein
MAVVPMQEAGQAAPVGRAAARAEARLVLGGAGGRDGAAGGITGSGGAAATGGASSAGGSHGTGGAPGVGGAGATGGTPGSGGQSGAGGRSNADGSVDTPSACPEQIPFSSVACQGSLACTYGQSVCCGHSNSAWTCTRMGGSFLCVQTVECNIICPGQDSAIGGDSAVDASGARDASLVDDAGVGAACGALTDPPCADGTYCEWSDNRCGAIMHGACAAIPRGVLCAISSAPVCGCDGQNYPGECQAAQAGVDVSSTATCPVPTGMFRCGWRYCRHDLDYCSAQVGGVVSNPGSYTCKALTAACNGAPSCACVAPNSTLCTADAQGDVTVTLPVP